MFDDHRIYHVWRADFLQRVRSKRLLVVLAVIAYLGYLVNVGDIELMYQQQVGPESYVRYRGAPNAAWTGLKAALTGTFFLGIVGFYVLKGVIKRDRSTGAGALVASTNVSNRSYLLGKWLSNVSVAALMVGTLAAATLVNHAVHGVGPSDPIALLAPVFLLGVPTGALVSGVSLLFETSRRLEGTLGNVVYFVIATSLLSAIPFLTAVQGANEVPTILKLADLFGYTAVYDVTIDAIGGVVPDYSGGPPSFGFIMGETETFRWEGSSWPLWVYGQRLLTAGLGAGIAVLGVYWFDRFEQGSREESADGAALAIVDRLLDRTRAGPEPVSADPPSVADVALTPVADRSASGLLRLLIAEFRLALKGLPSWWFLGVAAIVAVGLVPVVPTSVVRQGVYPLALVWPLFVWSKIGVRPAEFQTKPLIYSSPSPLKQLLAEWCVGAILVAAVASGVVVRLVASGETGILVGYVAAIAFIPAFALAVGIWSGKSHVFEALYLAVWYVGVLNRLPILDFAGVSSDSVSGGVPLVFIAAAAVLLAVGFVRRYAETR